MWIPPSPFPSSPFCSSRPSCSSEEKFVPTPSPRTSLSLSSRPGASPKARLRHRISPPVVLAKALSYLSREEATPGEVRLGFYIICSLGALLRSSEARNLKWEELEEVTKESVILTLSIGFAKNDQEGLGASTSFRLAASSASLSL
ncbi:hypothetical protein PMAYCL1PPCAC_01222, partial [Pristionchus mayeri]